MRNNIDAAREIVAARSAQYAATLWAEVAVLEGPGGPYATFPEIVRACIVGRQAALTPARADLERFRAPDFDPVAVEVFAAWFLDFRYFQFSFEQVQVALLFGAEPVEVSPEMGTRLSLSAAQFLCGYEEHDAEKRADAAPFAALAIKEAMWGGPLPEEWI
jgi:hypothetical protein